MSQSTLDRTRQRFREAWPEIKKAMQTLDPALVAAAERVTEHGHGREPAICELRCENENVDFRRERKSVLG